MASIFEKWNTKLDSKAIEESITEINENGSGNREQIPHGQYEVKVEKMELVECKSEKNFGEPMITIWFKIVAGEYKGQFIFYNRLYSTYTFIRHEVAEMLSNLLDNEDFKPIANAILKEGTKKEIGEMLLDIHEEIDCKFEYDLKYDKNKKGYDTYEITDVYEVE